MTALIAGSVVTLLAAIGMGAARLIGAREWWHYLAGGTVVVGAAGAWLASAGSAMATSVDPTNAFWRGAIYGGGMGLFASAVLIGCWLMLRRAAGQSGEK
ncbi:MAG: hypothetical protein GKS06_15230 [Acidobacteria bacterium]|nr:hypothetical protein [Acidobacteriota bacterium]